MTRNIQRQAQYAIKTAQQVIDSQYSDHDHSKYATGFQDGVRATYAQIETALNNGGTLEDVKAAIMEVKND